MVFILDVKMKSTTQQLFSNNNVNGNGHVAKAVTTTSGKNGTATTGDTKNVDGLRKTDPAVYIVFISLLLDLLAFTIILPLLPSILEMYRVNDSSGLYVQLRAQVKYFQELVGAPEKYSSVLFGGFLGSMFSFLQFVVSPIMGGLSDYYGRKPIMLISLVSIVFVCPFIKILNGRILIVGFAYYFFFRWVLRARMGCGPCHRIS